MLRLDNVELRTVELTRLLRRPPWRSEQASGNSLANTATTRHGTQSTGEVLRPLHMGENSCAHTPMGRQRDTAQTDSRPGYRPQETPSVSEGADVNLELRKGVRQALRVYLHTQEGS